MLHVVAVVRMIRDMKHVRLSGAIAVSLVLAAGQSSAACLAEYKAKRDNPLRLEHGIMAIPDEDCEISLAEIVVRERLAEEGWTLLSVVSVGREG